MFNKHFLIFLAPGPALGQEKSPKDGDRSSCQGGEEDAARSLGGKGGVKDDMGGIRMESVRKKRYAPVPNCLGGKKDDDRSGDGAGGIKGSVRSLGGRVGTKDTDSVFFVVVVKSRNVPKIC